MRRVSWKELRDICRLLGCVDSRIKGDHFVMTRPDLARPVVIKMENDLGDDIIRTNMRTLGVKRPRFDELLDQVRGVRKAKKKAKQPHKPK